ncbi:MAG TPA: dicarboxylate/amino acid:cation symporter [Blastocatellia bacterium]|nr:dicarboxylate/amino acid:cation symporter [Blastocatellia bacterium]
MTDKERSSDSHGLTPVLIALLLGITAGTIVAAVGNQTLATIALSIEPLGTLWTNAIRMTVIPLVAALVINSVASQTDLRRTGRLGALALTVFVCLLVAGGLFAALVAPLSLAHLNISPDVVERLHAGAVSTAASAEQMPTVVQRVLDMVPVNPIKAAADGTLLPLVVFTFIFAVALTRLEPSRRDPVVRFFNAVGDALLIVVRWVLVVAPIGIFALALALGVRMGVGAAGALANYLITTCAILFAFMLLLYVVAWLFGGVSIKRFAEAALPAQAVAIGSRSSLAALPALITGATDGLKLPARVTGFALPLATSLFKVSVPMAWVPGALFLSRLYGVNLSTSSIFWLVGTAVLISFSVPGIPGASIYLIAPVLVGLGLPPEGAGILLAVDAIPDMFKTSMNVTANLTVAAILCRFSPVSTEDRVELPVAETQPSALGTKHAGQG